MKNLIIICSIVFFLILLEILREISTFKVTHYEIISRKLSKNMKEKKIVFISDLHNYSYGKRNNKLIGTIEQENPDIIFSAGDLLVGKKNKSTKPAEEFIESLAKRFPIYCINGNHEQRMKEEMEVYGKKYAEYRESIIKSGVNLLENDSVLLEWEGKKVRINGLEIPLSYYRKFSRKKLSLKEIEVCLGKSNKDVFEILLAHNPVHAEVYAEWGADLILSGHLHGGIVRIPFLGGIITPQMCFFPKYSGGLYEIGEKRIVVSKGLGIHSIPIRLFNEAEVIVLHIKGKG
ncbi:metallophosphoesterase [Faecalimonas sp.]